MLQPLFSLSRRQLEQGFKREISIWGWKQKNGKNEFASFGKKDPYSGKSLFSRQAPSFKSCSFLIRSGYRTIFYLNRSASSEENVSAPRPNRSKGLFNSRAHKKGQFNVWKSAAAIITLFVQGKREKGREEEHLLFLPQEITLPNEWVFVSGRCKWEGPRTKAAFQWEKGN